MEINFHWSNWFVFENRKKKKLYKWMLVDIPLEEELALEVTIRNIYNTIDPDDFPDFISALAKDNLRLVKVISQAAQYCDKD